MQELRETLAALEDQLALRDEQARRPPSVQLLFVESTRRLCHSH